MAILKQKTTASILANFRKTVDDLNAVADRETARATWLRQQAEALNTQRAAAEAERETALAAAAKIGALLE